MRRMTIHDKKDTFVPAMHQTLEKFYEHRSPYSLWGDHKSKLTFGADCRNHVERKSLAGLLDHRSLADGCPSRSRMKVRTNPRLVGKKNLRSLAFGLCPNFRILSFYPLLDQRGVLFKRFCQRPLATQPQLRQKPTHRSQAQLHVILPPDQRADHPSRPQRKRKLQLQRIVHRHCPINPLNLSPLQLVRPSIKLSGLKRSPAGSPIRRQPVVNAGSRKTQHTDNHFWALATLNSLHRPNSYRLQGLVVQFPGILSLHTNIITPISI